MQHADDTVRPGPRGASASASPHLPPAGASANPYRPPARASEAKREDDHGAREGKWALLHVVASVALIFASMVSLPGTMARACGVAGGLVAFAGVVRGIRALVRIARAPGRVKGPVFAGAVVSAVLANGFFSLAGAMLSLLSTSGYTRGRQLRSFGRVLLPRVGKGAAWAHLPLEPASDPALRAAVAAQWRENGRTEHASVGAFARLTLDLMALGAPPALLAAANRDALDEIRHTELCFSLARALDGKSESPAPFPDAARARTLPPTRTFALAALAVDSLIDGALHEGLSARVIVQLARRCEDASIRAVLREIAADEGRHAAHGWDVVAWCLTEGGEAVADALRGAVAALPETVRSPLPEAAWGGAWERLGIHGHALEAEGFARTRADLVTRVGRMVGEERAAA